MYCPRLTSINSAGLILAEGSMVFVRIAIICAALIVAGPACAPGMGAPVAASQWSDAALKELITLAEALPAEGLPSEQTAIDEIKLYQRRAGADPIAANQINIAADTLHERLARTYAQGAADPALADPAWHIPRPPAPDTTTFLAAGRRNASAIRALGLLPPKSEEYRELRAELARVTREEPNAVDAQGRSREARLVSLRASLERWRWLPREFPDTRVEVRIAQFQVTLHRPSGPATSYAAIVGARDTQTPAFVSAIGGITLNPAWTPPRSILVNEIVPSIRRNPAAAGPYDIIDSSGNTIPSASVNWAERPFPYLLRQRPGPSNALGRIKFEMPNPYDVYLHDTPSRALFARDDRALSHGCVRVERPVDLAEAILAPVWTAETLETEISTGATRTLIPVSPVPVFALYLTATSDGNSVSYADDLYNRDAQLIAMLDAPEVNLVAAAPHSVAPPCAGAG